MGGAVGNLITDLVQLNAATPVARAVKVRQFITRGRRFGAVVFVRSVLALRYIVALQVPGDTLSGVTAEISIRAFMVLHLQSDNGIFIYLK